MALRRKAGATSVAAFPGFAEVHEIGAGSLATVYQAREIISNRHLALKVLNVRDPSPAALESFHRELIAVGAFAHPNVVTLFGTFALTDGRPVLVLELCRYAVTDRLRSEAQLPVQEAVSIAIKIAGALETAHRAGIAHRDVKPQNILVTEFGEPALADFGLAMLQAPMQTTAGHLEFTTMHAAPELLEAAATDVYELASTLYQLIAGQAAFRSYDGESPASVIARILRDPVPPLVATGVPVALSDLLIRAMSKDQARRSPTAVQFAVELAAIEAERNWPRTQFLIRDPMIGAPSALTRLPGQPGAMPAVLATERPVPPPAFGPPGNVPALVWTDPGPSEPTWSEPTWSEPTWSEPTWSEPTRHAVKEPDDGWSDPTWSELRDVPAPGPRHTSNEAPPREGRSGPAHAAPTPLPLPPLRGTRGTPALAPGAPATPPRAPARGSRSPAHAAPEPPEPPESPPSEPPESPPSEPSASPPSEPSAHLPSAAPAPAPILSPPGSAAWPGPPPPRAAATPTQPAVPEPETVPPVVPSWPDLRRRPVAPTAAEPAPAPMGQQPPHPARVLFPSPPATFTQAGGPTGHGGPGAPSGHDGPRAPTGRGGHGGPGGPDGAARQLASGPHPQRPPFGARPFGGDMDIDPMSLRARLRLHAGTTGLTADGRGLTTRFGAKRNRIPWTDVLGFEARLGPVDEDGIQSGALVALTVAGPIELPATGGTLAEVRYAHAMLEAYRVRAQLTQSP